MTSFLFPTLMAAKPSHIALSDISVPSLDERLTSLLDFLKNLREQKLLDGEILIAREGKTLLHLQSQDISSSDSLNEPQFMIGSVSKQFFAVALLKSLYESSDFLTEELKIENVKKQLHIPISEFLPEESSIWDGNMPSWANEISLHHLLSHTSGIPNYTAVEGFESSNLIDPKVRWFESYRSTNEIIKLISKDPLLFSPGLKFSYCNTGYVIIAEVIEVITGLAACQYIQEALFDPLELNSTANPVRGQWDVLKLEPRFSKLEPPLKYDPKGNHTNLYPLLHCDDISVAIGGGSIISTAADLLKWNQFLHKEKSVLPLELYNLLIKPNKNHYGYGIGNEDNSLGTLLGHDGGIGSYRTLLLYMPKYDFSVVILSNVCSDFDKIESEFKEIEESLKETIPDEKKRKDTALRIISEKYPKKRGFEIINEQVGKLFL